jgi:pimeloyl-ACP methyl ester carboxylesterase
MTPSRRVSTEVRYSDAALPSWAGVLPAWPGTMEAGTFVRRTPGAGTEPALFVHGLGGSATNWTDLMGLLADEVAGEAIDLPGFGYSDPPRSGSYRLNTHVKAVVRRIEARGEGPVHLFGNSLGGTVSTRVAAYRPELVRSLTLVSPALPNLRPKRGSDPRLPLLLVPGLSQLAARQMGKRTPEQRAKSVLRLVYGDYAEVPAERLAEAVEEVRRRLAVEHAETAFTASLRGLISVYLQRGPLSLWRQAQSVQAPTLLIWGSKDRLVDVALAPRAAAAFPDNRLLVLPGVGHVAQMERPETVARAFLGMLADVAAQEARPAAS